MKNVYPISILSKVVLLFFLLLAEGAAAQAPIFEWAKRTGGSDLDYGRAIATDGSGNSYLTGSFVGSITFGNTTLTSSGNFEVFIAKYDAYGNVLWAQQAGGAGSEAGFGIAVDSSGNSYITGSFEGSALFGNTTLTSNGAMDVFVAKYDASGNALWASRVGGATEDVGRAIVVDRSGNSYITGSFEDSVTFGSTTYLSSGLSDVFVAKFDASGNAVWANVAGGAEMDSGYGIGVDENGNSYISGFFRSSAFFGSTMLISNGFSDFFIAKIDSSGNMLWAQDAGGTTSTDAISLAIATDGSGNSYVTGHFRGSATFGSTTLNSSGLSDLFITKYDPSGNMLWVRRAGGQADDSGRGITIDGSGNSYVTGFFTGNASFGSTTLISSGTTDVFVAKLNASGNIVWARKAGGPEVDFGLGIAVDSNGNTYATGFFGATALFGSTALTSSGDRDLFLAKLSLVSGLPSESIATLLTYPSPFTTSFQLTLASTETATATLIDMLGRQVHQQVIVPVSEAHTVTITPPSNLSSGLYLLQLQQGTSAQVMRVAKQ